MILELIKLTCIINNAWHSRTFWYSSDISSGVVISVSDRIFGSIWKYNCGHVLTHHYTYQTLILINLKIRNLYSYERVPSTTFDILNGLTASTVCDIGLYLIWYTLYLLKITVHQKNRKRFKISKFFEIFVRLHNVEFRAFHLYFDKNSKLQSICIEGSDLHHLISTNSRFLKLAIINGAGKILQGDNFFIW